MSTTPVTPKLTHFRVIQGGLSPKDDPRDDPKNAAPAGARATQPEPVIVTGSAKLIITSATTLQIQFWTDPTRALAIDIEMPDGVAVTRWLRQHGLAIPVPSPPPK